MHTSVVYLSIIIEQKLNRTGRIRKPVVINMYNVLCEKSLAVMKKNQKTDTGMVLGARELRGQMEDAKQNFLSTTHFDGIGHDVIRVLRLPARGVLGSG